MNNIIVTGGAGFIGSNLVEKLLSQDYNVHIVDNFIGDSEKKRYIISDIYSKAFGKKLWYPTDYVHELDLYNSRNIQSFQEVINKYDIDTVFHLSAIFGGRSFVDTQQTQCAKMFTIDHNVIEASSQSNVDNYFYASSACVYPPIIQTIGSDAMTEQDVIIPENAYIYGFTQKWWTLSDNLYGWAKLMGELQCKLYHEEKNMNTSTCRFLTVYGIREIDTSHAISALIEKALLKQEPFEIWGDGLQERGFTYVSDIVDGMIKAVEHIKDGTAINLGTNKRYNINYICDIIFDYLDWIPKSIHYTYDKEGVRSRGLDISLAKQLLNWEPIININAGLGTTIDWHKMNNK